MASIYKRKNPNGKSIWQGVIRIKGYPTVCYHDELKQAVIDWAAETERQIKNGQFKPETHANAVREAMGRTGAGKIGDYSYCSYSVKGVGRFMPNKGSRPFLGKEGILEEVIEERIETVCNRAVLEQVLEEIKKAHFYEETVIDIYPVYEIGQKKSKR